MLLWGRTGNQRDIAMQNPYELDPFWRGMGEAEDARREERLRYGRGHVPGPEEEEVEQQPEEEKRP